MLDDYRRQQLFDGEKVPPPPIWKAQVLINLHFQRIANTFEQYETAELGYRVWILDKAELPLDQRVYDGEGSKAYREYLMPCLKTLRRVLADEAKRQYDLREGILDSEMREDLWS